MRTCLVAFLLFSLAMAARAGEREAFEPGYELAREKGCFECHALGRTEVGPAFQAIARRYRFDAQAREHLPYVVRGGSAGHWGDRFAQASSKQSTELRCR